MCRECDKIDKKIERYKRLKEQVNDQTGAPDRLVAELEAKKALHP